MAPNTHVCTRKPKKTLGHSLCAHAHPPHFASTLFASSNAALHGAVRVDYTAQATATRSSTDVHMLRALFRSGAGTRMGVATPTTANFTARTQHSSKTNGLYFTAFWAVHVINHIHPVSSASPLVGTHCGTNAAKWGEGQTSNTLSPLLGL